MALYNFISAKFKPHTHLIPDTQCNVEKGVVYEVSYIVVLVKFKVTIPINELRQTEKDKSK